MAPGKTNTEKPLNNGHLGSAEIVRHSEVSTNKKTSAIQKLL